MWRASEGRHGLCDHRDVAFNFNLHIIGAVVEAFSHVLDGRGLVSDNRFPFEVYRAFTSGPVGKERLGADLSKA